MVGRLVRRAIVMTPQGRSLAAAVLVAKSPVARRVAKWLLLAEGVKKISGQTPAKPGPAPLRSAAKGAFVFLGAAGVAAFAVREFPAVRREVKIWLM